MSNRSEKVFAEAAHPTPKPAPTVPAPFTEDEKAVTVHFVKERIRLYAEKNSAESDKLTQRIRTHQDMLSEKYGWRETIAAIYDAVPEELRNELLRDERDRTDLANK
jgi:hypothetical protein